MTLLVPKCVVCGRKLVLDDKKEPYHYGWAHVSCIPKK